MEKIIGTVPGKCRKKREKARLTLNNNPEISWHMKKSRRTYNGVHLNKKSNTQDVVEQSLTIYLAEIYDDSGAELLRGLSLYRLIDEMVIFLLPVISSETVPVSKHISTDKWELVRTKTFRNGICRLTYRKTLQ